MRRTVAAWCGTKARGCRAASAFGFGVVVQRSKKERVAGVLLKGPSALRPALTRQPPATRCDWLGSSPLQHRCKFQSSLVARHYQSRALHKARIHTDMKYTMGKHTMQSTQYTRSENAAPCGIPQSPMPVALVLQKPQTRQDFRSCRAGARPQRALDSNG